MNLSTNFTLEEMTQSQTATRQGIPNQPGSAQTAALRALCETILEPIRAHFNAPVRVSSGYRSPKLNQTIGGSATSQHCKGEAADFTVVGHSVDEVFEFIKASDLPFDQVIHEFGAWVHVSHTRSRINRRQALRAVRRRGRAEYLAA